jgi:membrane fusion protein, heavy metal efflux system
MHHRIRYLSLLVFLTVAAAWLWAHEGHQVLPTRGAAVDVERGLITLSAKAVQALGVQSERIRAQSLEERIVAPAVLVAPWQGYAFATSRIEGQITGLHIKPGQTVTAGQMLAEVQSLELENLQLELASAANDARVSGDNLTQLEAAARTGALTPQEVQEARTRHQENVLTVSIARRKLHSLGVDDALLERLQADRAAKPLKTLPIRSPIAGVVVHADVRLGQAIQPSDHLFEVVDLAHIWVQVRVLEKDWPRIAVGQPVEVRLSAYPTDVYRATIEVKGQALDPETYLGSVWASIAPSRPTVRLLPGMFGQAEIFLPPAKKALTVPATALLRDGVERYVLLEEGPGQYVRRNVVIGRAEQDRVEILQADLGPADRVVTAGSHELASLLPVTVLRPSKEAEKNIELKIESARKRSLSETVTLGGIVDLLPGGKAIVSSRLPGVIGRIHVDRSQSVKAGEIVAEVASLEFQQLQLDLLRQHLQAELFQESLQRLRSLGDKGNVALNRRQLREAESAYNTARQRRDSLQRKLEAVGLSIEQIQTIIEKRELADSMPIRSPIAGVIVNFPAKMGQFVKTEDPLFEVHDLAHPLLHGYVSERDLPRVFVGQRGSIRLAADPRFQADGNVVRLGQVIGSTDRTLSVWVELAAAPKQILLAGMMARLTLRGSESSPVLAVRQAAILREGNRAYVFVRQPDGIFARRAVETGRSDDPYIEIMRGLTEGELVAVQGVAELQTGYASLK